MSEFYERQLRCPTQFIWFSILGFSIGHWDLRNEASTKRPREVLLLIPVGNICSDTKERPGFYRQQPQIRNTKYGSSVIWFYSWLQCFECWVGSRCSQGQAWPWLPRCFAPSGTCKALALGFLLSSTPQTTTRRWLLLPIATPSAILIMTPVLPFSIHT